MKKTFSYIALALFTLSLGLTVAAQTTDNVGTLPDSPFYFVKSWQEGIQTLLISGAENKSKQYFHLAELRLAEYQKMVEKGKDKIAQKTLEKYQRQLNQALEQVDKMKKENKDTKDISQQINNGMVKALLVLQTNLQKAPESAKKGIQNAIDALQKKIGINQNNDQDNNSGGNANNNSNAEQKCTSSGGTVKTMSCCKSASDFPNLCGIGACGCSADNSKDTKICDCGDQNECFNGNQCISRGNDDVSTESKSNCAIKKGASMTYEEAKAIAEKECGYPIKEQHTCNSYTGTWWLDLDINKPGCNPACVVNLTNKSAEINWRCTGLILPK